MSNDRKFLEGELRYAEGKTNVKGIMKTIANELVKTDWIEYQKRGVGSPWTFDKNREIELPEVFKKTHIKLYKIIALSEIVPLGIPFGKIEVLRGISSFNDRVVILRLNGKQYSIPCDLGDTKEQVATKVANYIKNIEGFAETVVDIDGVTVIVKGSYAVFEIFTNYESSAELDSDILSFSQVKKGYKTGRIEIIGDCKESGQVIVTINNPSSPIVVALDVLKDTDTAQSIAEGLRDKIIAETPFKDTYIVPDTNIILIEGDLDVNSISLNTDTASATTSSVEIRPTDNVGILEIYSTAIKNFDIIIEYTDVLNNPRSRTVRIQKGDTNRTIASKVSSEIDYYSRASGSLTRCNVTNNVVTFANIKTLTTNITLASPPIAVSISEIVPARGTGVIEYLTGSTLGQELEIKINGDTHKITIGSNKTKQQIASEVEGYFLNHPSEIYKLTYINPDNTVIIRGKVDVTSIDANTSLKKAYPYTISQLANTDRYKGEIRVIQPMSTNDNLIITINMENIIVPLTTGMTEAQIATKIKDTILLNTTGFADTVVDVDDDKLVIVQGNSNVDKLQIGYVEIPESDFEVVETTIMGVGNASSGTNIGDNVIIKVLYTGEEFQRLCFEEKITNNGDIKNIAKLKSRPQGDIRIYEDTILKVTSEIAENKGDGLVYKLGKTPISQSKTPSHKLIVYKNGATIIPENEYTVDYYNGVIIFLGENQSANVITADYGILTGVLGNEINKSKYKIIDDEIIDMTSLGELANKDIVVNVSYSWEIAFPLTLQQVDDTTERMVLKTQIDSTQLRNKTFKKDYYVEFRHTSTDREEYMTGLQIRFGTMLDSTKTSLDNDNCSAWARVAWYDRKGMRVGGETLKLQDWTPITYHMNYTQEYVNIILHGSPVVDNSGRDNYLISPIMIGALENYEEVRNEDIQFNFGMAVGSDEFYTASKMPKQWGDKTGTSITDFTMERTNDGSPYQAHSLSFHTSPEFMDKTFLGTSQFTNSQHFSKMVITHEVERERGMIQSVLIGDRSTIFHLDELITNKDEFSKQGALLNERQDKFNKCGKANISQEKKWVMFNINSPYWIGNNSPNTFYGIALRKS